MSEASCPKIDVPAAVAAPPFKANIRVGAWAEHHGQMTQFIHAEDRNGTTVGTVLLYPVRYVHDYPNALVTEVVSAQGNDAIAEVSRLAHR